MTDDSREVTRSVDLDAAPHAVWDAVADPETRRDWLDDEDAARRVLRVDRIDEGRALSWTWWHPDDVDGASHVDLTLTRLDNGGTRLIVTERRTSTVTAQARAQGPAAATAALWDDRLLGVELLLATAAICVA